MLVSEIGEFGLIRLLAKELGVEYPPRPGASAGSGLLLGIGDDAVVTRRQTGALVWTTDTVVAGVHFLPGRSAWRDVGWKALAVNLSDLAAMGAQPHLALVTLMLPPDAVVEDVLDLYRGLKEAASEFEVIIGGGDIVRAPVFAVTVALSGWAYEERLGSPRLMTRGAARPGDLVAVSGNLGDAAGGLKLLLDGSAANATLVGALERPMPQVKLGRMAAQTGVRCAVDLSDGLVQDLGHIATASGVAIRLEAVRVPLSAALTDTFPGQALGLALSGGEDYQLALIGSRAVIESLLDQDATLTEIGEVMAGEPRVSVIDETGREIALGHPGWDHLVGQ